MPVDLDELERLEREATPGPWTIDDPDGDRDWMSAVPESQRHDFRRYYDIEMKRTDSPTGRFYMSVPTSFEDAHFIATARNALPALLAELRALRARVAEIERDLDACRVELYAARAAVGEAWFAGGVTLAEAIERKCLALESDASRFDSSEVHRTIQSEKHMSETDETDVIKYPHHDMHLRDLLAAKVIQGLLANPSGPIQVNGMSGWGWCNCTIEEVADLAWFIADHMLKARGGSNAG